MDLETLKHQIVATVDASQDEILLQDIADILSMNGFNKDEAYYKNRLEESIKQADAGSLTSNETVHQMARQWITK